MLASGLVVFGLGCFDLIGPAAGPLRAGARAMKEIA
jgi:hypothetical protein